MIQIRPVSDLRNKFPEIETIVNSGNPVYLTKNGYGSMVVLSLEEYASLTNNVEMNLMKQTGRRQQLRKDFLMKVYLRM